MSRVSKKIQKKTVPAENEYLPGSVWIKRGASEILDVEDRVKVEKEIKKFGKDAVMKYILQLKGVPENEMSIERFDEIFCNTPYLKQIREMKQGMENCNPGEIPISELRDIVCTQHVKEFNNLLDIILR